ncbi:MAG TPA: hypothetical protein VNA25_25035 [Phycisphaerae bacterium]|nr:hypothetical protein [Phycisphaerae bacterium]
MSPGTRQTKPKRRWWQVLIRVAVLAGLVLLGAYVTLPWWVPTGWLRSRIERQMSEQMGVATHIEHLSLSWSGGVEIRDLVVDSPEPFGPGAMVFVSRLRADFSPLDLLLHRRMAWMEIDNPRLFIRVDRQGRLNLAPLAKLKFDVITDRISVRRGLAVLKLPDREEPIRLDISNVEVLAGRFYPVGRVALSAALDQGLTSAPVSVRFSEGARGGDVAGTASLTFRNLNLQRLKLERLFGLPLRKLTGDCSGEAAVSATRQGKVNRFALNVSVRRLDAQPAHGPDLPVIDQALVRMAAGFDFLTGRLDIRSAGFRLPGVDLTGEAVAYLDSHGQWERVSSLELQGHIFPQRLAVLLRGRAPDQDEPQVQGPVHVRFAAKEKDDAGQGLAAGVLSLTAHADADEAVIRRGRHILKPAGRRLQVFLGGDLDMSDLTYTTAGEQVVLLGENRFTGAGAVRNIELLTARWSEQAGPVTIRQALADLSHIQWAGSWQIRDLQSLADMWPSVSGLLGRVELGGQITGQASIDHAAGTVIRARATIPAEANFAVGSPKATFRKPAGEEMKVVFSGTLGDGNAAMSDIDVFVWAGGGRLHVSNANAALLEEPNAPPVLTADAPFELEKAESFLQCLALPPEPNVSLRGNMEGRASLELGSRGATVRADIHMDNAAIFAGEYYRKPAGRRAALSLSVGEANQWGGSQQIEVSYRQDSSSGLPGVSLWAWARVEPQSAGRLFGESVGRAEFDANFMDLAMLAETSPWLAKRLAGGQLSGQAGLSGWLAWDYFGNRSFAARFDGNGLRYISAGPGPGVEMAGDPFTVSLGGRIRPTGDDGKIDLDLSLDPDSRFGGSTMELVVGGAVLDPKALTADGKLNLGAIEHLEGNVSATVSIDDALLRLVPDLRSIVERYGLSGRLRLNTPLALDGKRIRLSPGIDANDLVIAGGKVVKPGGVAAALQMELELPRDLSSVTVASLRGVLSDANISASGSARLQFQKDGRILPADAVARFAFSTGKAQTLHRLAPALAPYKLSGDFGLSAEWADREGGLVPKAEFRASRLSAMHRGRRVEISGQVRAERINGLAQLFHADVNQAREPNAVIRVGMIATDGLEFRVGENHGWIVADLTDPLSAPSGRVRLLAEHIDSKDLSDWLGEPNATTGDEQPNPKQSRATERQATEAIASLRGLLGRSRVDVRCSIDRFRTFDPDVGRAYDVRHMAMDANIDRGRLMLELVGGVGGGTVRRLWRTDLNEPSPVLATEVSYRDVLATDDTRPQLARFFPGNTVHGSFTHNEAQTMPLASAVANTMDPRYPLGAGGSGKTIAVDGVVEGRAAPRFVTAIFPGLNLTQYRYKKMTAFSDYKPDGSVESDMIFTGTVYDLYMEGVTDANSIARYQSGLILLSPPQTPELNHDLKLGRIPILIIRARIAGGQLHDMEVSYPWPNESLGTILIKNNPFYRLWLTLQK